MTQATTKAKSRVRQGDVFRDIDFIESASEESGIITVSKIRFPYVIVLTQDCDLEQDYKFRWTENGGKGHDKWLLSVLVAPLYNLEHVFNGEHLSELSFEMQQIKKSGTKGKLLTQNQVPRYHYLEFPDSVPVVPSAIDFKHYFSISVSTLHGIKSTNFVCSVSELYREDISHRFASFLSRIGLPEFV